MRKFAGVIFLMVVSLQGFTQEASVKKYPRYYFRNPLGIPMRLAANFGELRSDHWHMGLDIRTDQKENLPVYAAADGYITHIGIRPQSFGRFIIINHPNGLSTLYAHLNDFYPQLEQYVTDQQYLQEDWPLELDFTNEKFPVHKSQVIAYSGNTGGSQGPHLHFEIFDTKTTKRLNPLLFGFPILDKIPPSLLKLAMYDRSLSVMEQTPQFFWLKKTDSGYIIPKIPVIKTGLNKISFALQAIDKMRGSDNPDGIYSARLFFDEQPVIGFVLDSIDYDQTLFVNAHIDYRERYNGGPFLQHLSQLTGDRGAVYHRESGTGIISLNDTNTHTIRIEVKDAYLNASQLRFNIQYNDSLSKPIPRKIQNQPFAPNQVNVLEENDFELYLPEGALYDTIQLFYFRNSSPATYALSAIHQVNDESFPLHENITVRIKPDRKIPDEWKDKLVLQRSYRGNTNIKKATWQDEWLTAKFGDFGFFQVFADVLPPQLNEPGSGDTVDLSPSARIIFSPTDNFGLIRNFRAELDSQWLRFTNDKSRNWIYNFDKRCPFGIHQLKVTVEDLVGNVTTKTWWFKRYPYTPPKKKMLKKKSSKKPMTKGVKKTIRAKKNN